MLFQRLKNLRKEVLAMAASHEEAARQLLLSTPQRAAAPRLSATPGAGETQSPADPRPVNTLHVTELVTRDTA